MTPPNFCFSGRALRPSVAFRAALAAQMSVIGFVGGSHCLPGYSEKLLGATRIIKDMRELPALVKAFGEGTLS